MSNGHGLGQADTGGAIPEAGAMRPVTAAQHRMRAAAWALAAAPPNIRKLGGAIFG